MESTQTAKDIKVGCKLLMGCTSRDSKSFTRKKNVWLTMSIQDESCGVPMINWQLEGYKKRVKLNILIKINETKSVYKS